MILGETTQQSCIFTNIVHIIDFVHKIGTRSTSVTEELCGLVVGRICKKTVYIVLVWANIFHVSVRDFTDVEYSGGRIEDWPERLLDMFHGIDT